MRFVLLMAEEAPFEKREAADEAHRARVVADLEAFDAAAARTVRPVPEAPI